MDIRAKCPDLGRRVDSVTLAIVCILVHEEHGRAMLCVWTNEAAVTKGRSVMVDSPMPVT